MGKNKQGRIRNYAGKLWNKRGYVSNGQDLATAGKIGAAAGIAYVAKDFLNKTANKLKEYTPGRVIKKVVTQTEKGLYNLDQKVEKEIKKVPGGKQLVNANKSLVSKVWELVPGVSVGSPEKPRTQRFYERHKIPMPYTRTKKTVTETRVPPKYNVDAANQKGLLGSAGMAINALLGLYAVKEGAKHFYNRMRGKKK